MELFTQGLSQNFIAPWHFGVMFEKDLLFE